MPLKQWKDVETIYESLIRSHRPSYSCNENKANWFSVEMGCNRFEAHSSRVEKPSKEASLQNGNTSPFNFSSPSSYLLRVFHSRFPRSRFSTLFFTTFVLHATKSLLIEPFATIEVGKRCVWHVQRVFLPRSEASREGSPHSLTLLWSVRERERDLVDHTGWVRGICTWMNSFEKSVVVFGSTVHP